MNKPTIHLVCNSHIDPVWLWEWEEGAGVALATFRTAADLCEDYESFIFNHNEAILYKWIEEYEPPLFRRIQALVEAGRWNIMGGWYLQPDCNLPSGESFVRQILLGKLYFREKFGVDVTTACNLDPFGHTRGLVQILARAGYDSYLFCRPSREDCPLPDDAFDWVGFDGSTITATRASAHYNSPPGRARAKVERWIRDNPDRPCSIILWGVGNHGGGPSRRDLDDLGDLIANETSVRAAHSTPGHYFEDLVSSRGGLLPYARGLNPWAVGCYTSMMRIKRRHRRLENALFMAEKMATIAASQGLIEYPRHELHQASCDLATAQFHDALPGSSIEPVEDATMRLLDHGLELCSRVRGRAFFALAASQPAADEGEYPILVFNPHPHEVRTIVECELQPPWPHGTSGFMQPVLRHDRRRVSVQAEKPYSSINEDHRKRIAFPAVLPPSQMSRFDCRLELRPTAPSISLCENDGRIDFHNRDMDLTINTRTGLVDRYVVNGVDYLGRNALRPLVMLDNADPWGMTVKSFREPAGRFKLASKREGTELSGVTDAPLRSVRIVEDGAVRSIVETILTFNRSCICQRYKLPKRGAEFEVELRIIWNEKDRMLKLSVPTSLKNIRCFGQVAFGMEELQLTGAEQTARQWVALVSDSGGTALSCINDATHGLDVNPGGLRLSLLRSPAHAGHPTGRAPITPQDRFTPRVDQGEHVLRFWFNAGPAGDRLRAVEREAQARAEEPLAINYCPPGNGAAPVPVVTLSDKAIVMSALKYAEAGDDLIIRLFNPTPRRRTTTLNVTAAGYAAKISLGAFEVRTWRFDRAAGRLFETSMIEDVLD